MVGSFKDITKVKQQELMQAAAKMFIESIAPATTDGQDNINMAAEYVSMGMTEIKKLYKEMLMEQPLLENGLTDNINMLVSDLKAVSNIKIICNFSGNIEILDASKKATLFRIVQEQFKNIARHSKAKLVHIEIKITKEQVELMIKDDGVSFKPEEIKWGIGFSSIHQRTQLYNGSITIKTAPGKGCKMVVKIPLDG
jgi:signal transduction histidine kinase